jgi:hypothetical protein
MILGPTRYDPDQFDMGNMAHLSEWDIVRMETEADHEYATRVMDIVLDNCGLTLQKAQAELEEAHRRLGERWADASNETIDVSYLYDIFHNSPES